MTKKTSLMGGLRSITTREDRTIDYVFRIIEIPWCYYALAVGIAVVMWLISKKQAVGLLAGYVFLIFVETLLIRHSFEGNHFQPELFWSWKVWGEQKYQIITNVIMFIPAGVLSGWFWRWKGIWFAVGLSGLIEILQLVTQRGLCEFDDILHNSLGAVIGIGIVMISKTVYEIGHGE